MYEPPLLFAAEDQGVAQHHRSAIGSQFVPLDPQEDQSEYQAVAGRTTGCGMPGWSLAGFWFDPVFVFVIVASVAFWLTSAILLIRVAATVAVASPANVSAMSRVSTVSEPRPHTGRGR
jgi:hypothetical protein